MKKMTLLFIFSIIINKVQSQSLPDPNKYYYVTLIENNQVIEQPGHDNESLFPIKGTDGTVAMLGSVAKLITTEKRNDDRQKWKFIKKDDNIYSIVNKKYGAQYINVPFERTNRGETLISYWDMSGKNQNFYLIAALSNTFFISSASSGLVLSKENSTEKHCVGGTTVGELITTCSQTVNANFVKQMGFTGKKNQQWKLVEAN